MGKRILGVVAAVLVLGLIWYAYQRHQLAQANEGAVTIDDSGPPSKATVDAPAPAVMKSVAPATAPTVMTSPPAPAPAVIPASDSIAPNPANGMTFAGTGKFQVYRQGNLTWRVDTESGNTCILFATMEEWRKPIVFQHGCANS